MKKLIICETAKDTENIPALLRKNGGTGISVLILYDELKSGYTDPADKVDILTDADLLDRNDPFVDRIDDFAVKFADEWYKAPEIKPAQEYRGIDLGGIVYRDFMYYLIWVLKNTAVIRAAVKKICPDVIMVFAGGKEKQDSVSAGRKERIAYKIVKELDLDDGVTIEEVATVPEAADKPSGGYIMEKVKDILDKLLCSRRKISPDGKKRILFSSDLKHVLEIIADMQKKQDIDVFYFRQRIGIRSFLKLKRLGCKVLSMASLSGRDGKNALRFFDVKEPDVKFLYNGFDLFPVIKDKIVYIFREEFVSLAEDTDKVWDLISELSPEAIVVEEDVCPSNKIMVQAGKKLGIKTFVLQHGMMGVSPGFIPLSSDHFLCWGEVDRQRMEDWGIERGRLMLGGSPRHENMFNAALNGYSDRCLKGVKEITLLYISSPYHAYYRPDFIDTHLTRGSHLRTLRALGGLKSKYNGIKIGFKFHPREKNKEETKEILRGYFGDDVTFHDDTDLSVLIPGSDIIISSWSSSCLEALMFGRRLVILNMASVKELYPIDPAVGVRQAYNEDQLMGYFEEAIGLSDGDLSEYRKRTETFIRKVFYREKGSAVERISAIITDSCKNVKT